MASRSKKRSPRKPIRLEQADVVLTLAPTLEQVQTIWTLLAYDPEAVWLKDDWSPSTFDDFVGRMGKSYTVILATIHGQVAGAAWLHHEEGFPGTRAPMHCSINLYVVPAYRGRASVLIGKALRVMVLDTIGYQQCMAVIRVENLACRHLMRAIGMHRVGMIPKYVSVDGTLRDVMLYVATPSDMQT